MSSFYPATAHRSIIKYLLLGLISGVLVVGITAGILAAEFLFFTDAFIANAQGTCTGGCGSLAKYNCWATVPAACDLYPFQCVCEGPTDTITDNCDEGYRATPICGASLFCSDENLSGQSCTTSNCTCVEVDYPPVADFSGSPTSGSANLVVTFTDSSTDDNGIMSWYWWFGDGEVSTAQNPSHTYTSGGTYTVILQATDGLSQQNTKTRTDYITVTPPPAAPTWATPTHTHPDVTSLAWDWNVSTGATYYQLADDNCVVVQDNIASSNYTENVGSANTQRTRKVKACNAAGCSACSAEASAYTSANTPVNLAGTVPAGVDGRTKINWSWASGGAQKDFYASNSAGNTGWTISTTWNQTDLTCNTSYTLKVKARNGDNDETSEATLAKTTRACNRNPYWSPVIPDTTAQEGTLKTYDVSGYAKDDDIAEFGDVLTFSKIAGPGAVSAAGVFTWTPSYIEAGEYSVKVRVTDGSLFADDIFQITVSDVNSAPILEAIGNKNVNENQLLSFTVYAADEENSSADLVITETGNGSTGATSWNGSKWQATYSWTPGFSDAGNHQVTFTVTDRQGLTDSETITITVANINRPPTIDAIADIVKIEGQTVSFDVVVRDPDLDNTEAIDYTISQPPKGGSTISFASGSYSLGSGCVDQGGVLQCTIAFDWTTNYFDSGAYTVTFMTVDSCTPFSCGASASEPLVITIQDTAPVLTIVSNTAAPGTTIQEEQTVSFTVIAKSEDQSDALKFYLDKGLPGEQSAGPFNKDSTGKCVIASGKLECTHTFSWTPGICAAGPNGADKDYNKTATVDETTGSSATVSDTKTITVTDKNRAVAFTSPATSGGTKDYSINEDQTLNFTVSAADSDVTECADNTLTYSCSEGSVIEGANRCTGSSFSWKPSFDAFENGPVYTFQYQVVDGVGSGDAITIRITVVDVNRAPYFNPDPASQNACEDALLSFDIFGYDDDPGDVLTYAYDFVVTPPGGSINDSGTLPKVTNNEATFNWTPSYFLDGGYPNPSAGYNVLLTVTDDGSTPPQKSDSHTITVTVFDKNRGPSLDAPTAKDVLETTELVFTAAPSDADTDNTLTHTITTPPGNHPGASISDPVKTSPFTPITIRWTPAYSFITNVENTTSENTPMTIQVNDASFQPQGGGCNGATNSSNDSTTITVYDANQFPVYTDTVGNQTIVENSTLTFSIKVSDNDGDSSASWLEMQDGSDPPSNISYPVSSSETGGYPNVKTFNFSWTPNYDQGGTDPTTCEIDYPVRIYAEDNIGNRFRGSSAETCPTPTLALNKKCQIAKVLTITVTNTNRPPAFDDGDIVNGAVNEMATLNMTIDISDPDAGDTLSCSITDVSPSYIDAGNPADITTTDPSAPTGTCQFSWSPNDLQAGTTDRGTREYWTDYTFTIKVKDNFGTTCGVDSSDTASFTIRVNDVNRQPDLSDNTSGGGCAAGAGEADICIREQATSNNSFTIINADPDRDNTFIYTYSSVPPLPTVDAAPKGITLGSPIVPPNKDSQFTWQPTYNQAYYNPAGTQLLKYTFTFNVDDERAIPYSDTLTVDLKLIDANRASTYNMLTTANVTENAVLNISIQARDYDYDYQRNKAEQFKFYLVSYKLNLREIPNDGTTPLHEPLAGKLFIDDNFISETMITGEGDPARESIINNVNIGAGNTCTDPLYRLDLDKWNTLEAGCSIQGTGAVGNPKYRLCTQTLRLDLTDPAFNQYDHMGEHQFIIEAEDRLGPPDHAYTDGMGDDPVYSEDNPLCPKHTIGIQVANVNRAPNQPILVSVPDDAGCQPLTLEGCQDHELSQPGEEIYDPANLVFEFTPQGDLDTWSHGDKIDYILYIKKIGPTVQDPAFTRRAAVSVFDLAADDDGSINGNRTITVNNLEPRTDYEWFIRAEDDAPCEVVTPLCTTLGVLTTDSEHWRFRTGIRTCSDGRECRKGEICVDEDNDGNPTDATPFLCLNSNECNPLNVICYLSACNPGEVDPGGASCESSPSNRVFVNSPGRCRTIDTENRCDLPAAEPNTPQACEGDDIDGSTCQPLIHPVIAPEPECGTEITCSIDLDPKLNWVDSDPAEIWNDYKGQSVSYPGDRVRYILEIWNGESPGAGSLYETYIYPGGSTGSEIEVNILDYQAISIVDRSFSFATDLPASPFYLNFDETYTWQVTADTEDATDPNPDVEGPEWRFATATVCDVINYDYLPDYYNDPEYQPNTGPADQALNDEHHPEDMVTYPVDVDLFWPPDQDLIDNGVLLGPGENDLPLYDLKMSQCDETASNCGPFGVYYVEGEWIYIIRRADYPGTSPEALNTAVSFDDINHAYLGSGFVYRWQIVVHHGRFSDEIATSCQTLFFKTPPTATVSLTKKITYLQDSEIYYQIDFEIQGRPWQRIKDFYIKDTYPESDRTTFQDTCNMIAPYTGVCANDGSADDTWRQEGATTVKDPATLYIDEGITEAASTYLKWYIKDDYTDPENSDYNGTVGVGSSGSLILTLREYTGVEEFPECTWLPNYLEAGGEEINDSPIIVSINPVTHLAGSSILDKSYLSTRGGNIHSNYDICLQNEPAAGIYVSDYFITAQGEVSSAARQSRAAEVLGEPEYIKESYADIPLKTAFSIDWDNIDYSELESLIELEPGVGGVDANGNVRQIGDCTVASLFDTLVNYIDDVTGKLSLGGQVFHCTGNLTIEPRFATRGLLIANNGGAGTVIVDGNLVIEDDIYYADEATVSIDELASVAWIVKGDVIIQDYDVYEEGEPDVPNCYPDDEEHYPIGKWCEDYSLVADQDGDEDMDLLYQPAAGFLKVGPVHIVGTYFAAGEVKTSGIHLPLEVEGSFIAQDVLLQRREFPD